MNEAATTWALIVGIDVYDDPAIPALHGAVADALAAYRWLRSLGVPDGQILLNASPSAAVKAELDAVRPGCPPAKSMDIDDSLVRLEEVAGGTRLFVFLSGHGLYEPTSERLFLTQEFTQRRPANLGLQLYVPRLLEMPFARQFLFMDGCQNQPYSQTERQKITGMMYGGRTGFTPRPGNGLVACYAAAKDQLALEVGGRGLFSRHLFEALDPARPLAEAVDLDFATGTRTVDLRKVLFECVQGKVQDEAWTQSSRMVQTPELDPHGAAQAAKTYPIFRLADEKTASVQVLIDPAGAAADVRRVRISAEEPPQWDLRVPRLEGQPLPLPVTSRLPLGVRVTAQCSVRSGAPWNLVPARYDFEVSGDQTLSFALQPKEPPAPAPPAPELISFGGKGMGYGMAEGGREEEIAVLGGEEAEAPGAPAPETRIELRTENPDGTITYNAFNYEDVAHRFGLSRGLASGGEVAPGVRFEHHEHGPDFVVDRPDAIRAGYEAASRWAEAIQRVTPPEVRVATRVRGDAGPALQPGLRISLPAGGPESLAGPLAVCDLLWAGPPGEEPAEPLWRQEPEEGQARDLRSLVQDGFLPLEPGPVRVRLDLPWGSWTRVLRVPGAGETAVELPAAVGTPPLRVTLHAEVERDETVILGVEGERPRGRLLRGLEPGKDVLPLDPGSSGTAAWALQPPRSRQRGDSWHGCTLVELTGESKVLFPLLAGRPLAVDLSGNSLRVEPLSGVLLPEWDLLVASGRLDFLGAEDAVNLMTRQHGDELLTLAAAYAVYAAPGGFSRPFFNRVKKELDEIARKGSAPDGDLLHVALRYRQRFSRPDGARDRARVRWLEQEAYRLEPWAEKRAVPLLRWGVTIALQLLAGLGGEPFGPWRDALAAIEPKLSPISVWTAWRSGE